MAEGTSDEQLPFVARNKLHVAVLVAAHKPAEVKHENRKHHDEYEKREERLQSTYTRLKIRGAQITAQIRLVQHRYEAERRHKPRAQRSCRQVLLSRCISLL